MFYSKECVENSFDIILKKLSEQDLFLFEPMPSYKEGEGWTDEIRISNGHIKLPDGSRVTIRKIYTCVEELKKGSTELYEENQKAYHKIELLQKQRHEMEYGLRVAEKALKNSLALTKETAWR